MAAALAGLGLFQGYASYRQTQIQNAQLRYRARVAKANASLARQEGDLAVRFAKRLEGQTRRQTDLLLGEERAAMAASGFVVGAGSFGDVLDTTAFLGEIDALTIEFEGEIEKFRKEQEARGFEGEARALRSGQADPGLAFISGFLGSPGARSLVSQ